MDGRRLAVCHDCLTTFFPRPAAYRIASGSRVAPFIAQSASSAWQQQRQHTRSRAYSRRAIHDSSHRKLPPRLACSRQTKLYTTATASTPNLDLHALHTRIHELVASVRKPEDGTLPSEQRLLYVFEQLQFIANLLLEEQETSQIPKNETKRDTATSALLGSVNARQSPALLSRASILNTVTKNAEDIIRHPDVFITGPVLKAYVELQTLLNEPFGFPDVFDLYARKPVPSLKGGRATYTAASPNKTSAAIDSKAANTAVSAAIRAHNLALAMDVITTSFCTLAYRKAKVLRQAAVPFSGLALAPVAAYTLSSSFSSLQQTMDPATANAMAFAGIMTYVGAVSMVGYVVVTTANDQMDRVTWATGVPLWERWIREEERAAIDRVAAAWGFKEAEKRGDEEGEDWEALREWVGRRGMVLDRVSLLEGME